MYVCSCGNEISEKRQALGFTKCLSCGDMLAKKETEDKSKRVALAYPKGPYMYTGSSQDAIKNLRDSTDTRRATFTGHSAILSSDPVVVAKAINSNSKRKAIGMFWYSGQTGSVGGTLFYSESDPRLEKASRKVFFDGRKG